MKVVFSYVNEHSPSGMFSLSSSDVETVETLLSLRTSSLLGVTGVSGLSGASGAADVDGAETLHPPEMFSSFRGPTDKNRLKLDNLALLCTR